MKPRYLFPDDYMADPSANVFNGKLYIYPSHDWEAGAAFDDDGGHFQMKDYHVLSCDDIENGPVTDHGVILDVKDVPWAEKQMWDNDCVEKNGKYYLIFSAKDYNGVFHLGVAVADKPEGPFTPQAMPIRGSFSIDPCVFKDDDGQIYTYFGGLWGGQLQWYRPIQHIKPEKPSERINPISPAGSVDVGPAPDKKTQLFAHADAPALPSCVVRMSDDVMQFAEAPRPVIILDKNGEPLKAGDPHRFFEASWMHKYNGKYYFSYSTGDSHFLCYAIGDNPYGPFTYQGVILDPVVGWTTHHSIVEFKGQWYLCYHDCVPSNDITHLRSLKVQQLFYNEDGTIKKMSDKQLLSNYYTQHRDEIVYFIAMRTKDVEAAQDMVQDLFLRLLDRHRLLTEQTLPCLVYTLARHAVADYYRKRRVYEEYEHYIKKSDSTMEMESVISAQQLIERMEHSLARLSEECRTVYRLHIYNGMKVSEISQQLSLPYKQVENRLGVARKTVRQQLKACV